MMENNTVNFRKAFVESEKSEGSKCMDNNHKIISCDDGNNVILVDKQNLLSLGDHSFTQIIKDDIDAAHSEADQDEGNNLEFTLQSEELLNSSGEAECQRITWNDRATKLLLSLYKQKEPLLGSDKFRNKKKMWGCISEKMSEQGYAYSAVQVENRFKTLLRSYKKVHHTDNVSIKSRKASTYQDEMDTIFIKDVAKLGNVEIQFEQDESSHSCESEDAKQNKSFLSFTADTENLGFKRVDWDERATKLLLMLYKEKKPLVELKRFKNKKEMWEKIAEEINSRNYSFSGVQVENRFKTVLRSYKKVLLNGKRCRTCTYQEELDTLFLEDDDVFPDIIAGSERRYLKREVSERLGIILDDMEDSDDLERDEMHFFKARREIKGMEESKDVLHEIWNLLAQSERSAVQRHSEIIEVLQETTAIQRKQNELLERLIGMQSLK